MKRCWARAASHARAATRAALAAGLATAAALAVGAAAALAAEDLEPVRGDARWLPAISAFSGVVTQDADASVDSTQRGFLDDDALAVFAHLGLGVELMAPALVSGLGAPRPFVHGDLLHAFDSEESIANEGDPGGIRIPIIDNNSDGIPDGEPPVAGILGRGSAAQAETQPWIFGAGAGLAFTVDVWGRALRLKPSIEWLYQETRVSGLVGDAEALDGGDQCPCRTVLVGASDTQGFHHLGAGLELELVTQRAGPLMLSIFASGQAYHVLGDRRVDLAATGDFVEPAGPPVETLTLNARYELQPWNYRLKFGLRVRWHPE